MRRKWSIRELARRHAEHSAPDQLTSTVLWLHNIRSMHKVGSVFRSADGFGIGEIWLSGHTPTPPRPEIHKTALGADKSVPWRYFAQASDVVAELHQQNRLLIGVEQTTDSIPLQDLVLDPSRPICVVFGNEVTGLDEDVLAQADIVTEIPQFGKKHSLNVSVAAGIVLFGLFSLMETQAHRP
jgi:tRNA G18 (ribose-2'-O)-methylase SpoU